MPIVTSVFQCSSIGLSPQIAPVFSIRSFASATVTSSGGIVSAWGPLSQATSGSRPAITPDSVTGNQIIRFDTGKTLTLPAGQANYLSSGDNTVICVWRQRVAAANADYPWFDSSGNGSTIGYQLQALDNRAGSEFRILQARVSNGSSWVVSPTNGTSGNYAALKWNVVGITTTATRAALTSDNAPVYDVAGAYSLPTGAGGALVIGGYKIDLMAMDIYALALTDAQKSAAIVAMAAECQVSSDLVTVVAGDGYGTQTMNFPGACRLNLSNNDILVAYRHGTGHGNDDGQLEIVARRGGVWGTPQVIYAPTKNIGITPFDPNLVRLSNGDILLSFFPWAAVGGLKLMRSTDNGFTWSAPATVTHGYTLVEAASSPILERSGSLYWPVYVQNNGEAFSSARVYKSTDNGASWPTDTLIASGVADGRSYQEPGLLNDANTGGMFCLARTPLNGMRETTSSDNGATWAATVAAIPEAISAARLLQTADLTIYQLGRPNTLSAATLYRRIAPGSWTTYNTTAPPAPGIDPTAGTMVYGTILELSPGVISCIYGDQQTNGPNGSAQVLYRDWPAWQVVSAMPGVISPASPTVAPLATRQFTATGAGNDVWSISPNNSGGSIGASTGLDTVGSTDHVTDTVVRTDLNGSAISTSVTVPFYAPTFTSASNVSTAGGNSSIVGTHFRNGCVATVDGATVVVTFNSATSLTLACPAHAAGAVNVVITNPDGQFVTGVNGLTYV